VLLTYMKAHVDFRLVPKSMTLNGIMASILRYSTRLLWRSRNLYIIIIIKFSNFGATEPIM